MAKERLHNLKQTTATFLVRGLVTGMKKGKAYQSGTTKNGGKWNSIEFGLNINNNKTVFIKLNGFPRDEVYYYKSGEKKGEKGTTKKVAWKDRKKSPGEGYRLIGINITTGKDENDKNINEMFTEYDAVEYLSKALHDGESLLVKGNMNFSSYVKNDQIKRKIELVPTQISYTQNTIDFDDENFKEMAEFENTIVFADIAPETDADEKRTGRFILSGYSIGYNAIENVSFIIDKDHEAVARAIKKKMKIGNAIKTYGRISVENNIEAVTAEDDEWGSTEVSPMERINAPVKREYIVYKVDKDTFDTETYSEESIAKALKAIKNAKEASEKFVDNNNEDVDSGWGDDEDLSTDEPW